MFKKFLTSLQKAPTKADDNRGAEGDSSSDDEPEEVTEAASLDFEIDVEIGGGKGWPFDVTVIYYHRPQGLICAGTEGGAVYTYGDGFQFLRPWLAADANRVLSIAGTDDASILVTYADNSLAVLSLPSLNVIDLLPGSWLPARVGNITSVYADDTRDRHYAYFGTSGGHVYVADVQSNIRICEYSLNPSDLGIDSSLSIVDLQICPKDEKYVAVGLAGAARESGLLIIFNLERKKPKQTYSTAAITSLAWNHQGEILYAGTRTGALLTGAVEKAQCVEVWNAREEGTDPSTDLLIRKLVWFTPQKLTESGCLFVLLGAYDEGLGVTSSADVLNCAITGLAPIGEQGQLQQVFSQPPLQTEEIMGFRVVPTVEKIRSSSGAVPVTPALLLLTQSLVSYDDGDEDDDDGDDEEEAEARSGPRQLKIVRCPACEVQDWALEMLSMEEARKATEVLPANAEVSCITAISPIKKLSTFTSVLLQTADSTSFVSRAAAEVDVDAALAGTIEEGDEDEEDEDDEDEPVVAAAVIPPRELIQRRMSARDFLSNNIENSGDIEIYRCSWDLVLATLGADDFESARKRLQDIVVLGHEDGSVIAWGVFLPQAGRERGSSNKHIPLRALRCGTARVTVLTHDDAAGLFVAGDEDGCVVMWEVFDSEKREGSSVRLRSKKGTTTDQPPKVAAAASKSAGPKRSSSSDDDDDDDDENDDNDEGVEEEEGELTAAMPDSDGNFFRPDSIQELLREKIPEEVSSILLLGELTTLLVGTVDGSVYFTSNFGDDPLRIVDLSKISVRGAVKGFHYSSFFYADASVPVVFVIFESGYVAVVDVVLGRLVAYGASSASAKQIVDEDDESPGTKGSDTIVTLAAAIVVDSQFHTVPAPNPYGPVEGQSIEGTDPAGVGGGAVAGGKDAVAPSSPASSDTSSRAASPTPSSSSSPQPVKQSFMGKLFRKNSAAPPPPTAPVPAPAPASAPTPSSVPIAAPAATADSTGATSNRAVERALAKFMKPVVQKYVVVPPGGPRYLLAVMGNSLVTFDLAKFSYLTNAATKVFTSQSASASTSTTLTNCPFIAGVTVAYVEEASRAWATPSTCFHCIDKTGALIVVSVSHRKAICSGNLIEGVTLPEQLRTGAVLSSGTCYLLKNEFMLLCASVRSRTHRLALPQPARIPTESCPPPSNMQLLTHVQLSQLQVRAAAAQKKKRQSTIMGMGAMSLGTMGMSAGPVDLDKLFAKTRSQMQKDELIGGVKASTVGSSSQSKRALASAAKVGGDMAELGEALNERGERINRLAQKMDQFKESSQEYSKNAKLHNEKLKAKSKAWGLGMF